MPATHLIMKTLLTDFRVMELQSIDRNQFAGLGQSGS
jgi:hypothetical protein